MKYIYPAILMIACSILAAFFLFVLAAPFIELGWKGIFAYVFLALILGVFASPFLLIDWWYDRKRQ